ncbi:MAG: hypothetical protein AB1589_11265 [Cyanobacteriota bacterium]
MYRHSQVLPGRKPFSDEYTYQKGDRLYKKLAIAQSTYERKRKGD